MPKQKKRLTMAEKKDRFKTVKAWLAEKEKARRLKEDAELGKMTVDDRAILSATMKVESVLLI